MRSRPTIVEVTVSPDVRPGTSLEVKVVLDSGSDTPVDSITFSLIGAERYRYATNQAAGVVRTIVNLVAPLKGKGTLTEGRHTFRARFDLPNDATPTYSGLHLFADYTMKLHVDIPWWPDRVQEYTLKVTPAVHARPKRAPLAQTTARGGDAPFIELTLDDTVLAPGDTLSGVLALANLRGRKVKGLRMALIAIERLTGGSPVRGVEYPVHFAPDAVREGREFPFRFTLDRSMPASFASPAASLSYALEVRAEIGWQKDLVHSAYVTLAALDRPPEDVKARPRLGMTRWRLAWEHAGAPLGLTLADPEELKLAGAFASVNAEVRMDPDADEPTFVANIEWSSWELDLRVRLRNISILASDPDGDGFGRRYKVQGRDPSQVAPLMTAPLRRALLAFDEVYVDDKHARVRAKAHGFDEPHIAPFLQKAAALSRELVAASARVPPPAAMAGAVPAWRAFGDEMGAELTVGTMSLRGGSLDGARFDVETMFEDGLAPTRTRLTLLPDPPIPEALDVESADAWVKAPPGSREIAATAKEGALAMRVSPQAIEVDVPAPLSDPSALRPRMEAMMALARRLRGEKSAGPYR